jgi:hypothetical protein
VTFTGRGVGLPLATSTSTTLTALPGSAQVRVIRIMATLPLSTPTTPARTAPAVTSAVRR